MREEGEEREAQINRCRKSKRNTERKTQRHGGGEREREGKRGKQNKKGRVSGRV